VIRQRYSDVIGCFSETRRNHWRTVAHHSCWTTVAGTTICADSNALSAVSTATNTSSHHGTNTTVISALWLNPHYTTYNTCTHITRSIMVFSSNQIYRWRWIFIKCSWINKKVWSKPLFVNVSWQRIEFNGLKHLTEKVTGVASLTRVQVVVHHTMPTPPHNKVNFISQWYFDQCLYPHQNFTFCQKYLEQAFFLRNFFIHIHLVKCLSSVVKLIVVTTLLLTSGLHRC